MRKTVYCSWDPQSYDCIISKKSWVFSLIPVLTSCVKEIPSICIYAAAAFAWQEVTLLLVESIKLDAKYCIHCQAIFVREHKCKLLIGWCFGGYKTFSCAWRHFVVPFGCSVPHIRLTPQVSSVETQETILFPQSFTCFYLLLCFKISQGYLWNIQWHICCYLSCNCLLVIQTEGFE